MKQATGRCPKCDGEMETGFLLDCTTWGGPRGGRPLKWVEGAQIGLGVKARPDDPGQIEVDAQRCLGCGYLELYAGMGND